MLLQADFGVLFDVDGVLARGSTPLGAAVQAIRLLEDDEGHLKVPVAFVTNACNRSHDKAAQIQKWLDIQVCCFKFILKWKSLNVILPNVLKYVLTLILP